jgi:hypothetical protein
MKALHSFKTSDEEVHDEFSFFFVSGPLKTRRTIYIQNIRDHSLKTSETTRLVMDIKPLKTKSPPKISNLLWSTSL